MIYLGWLCVGLTLTGCWCYWSVRIFIKYPSLILPWYVEQSPSCTQVVRKPFKLRRYISQWRDSKLNVVNSILSTCEESQQTHEEFKKLLDNTVRNIVWILCGARSWTLWYFRSLPTQNILWFCVSPFSLDDQECSLQVKTIISLPLAALLRWLQWAWHWCEHRHVIWSYQSFPNNPWAGTQWQILLITKSCSLQNTFPSALPQSWCLCSAIGAIVTVTIRFLYWFYCRWGMMVIRAWVGCVLNGQPCGVKFLTLKASIHSSSRQIYIYIYIYIHGIIESKNSLGWKGRLRSYGPNPPAIGRDTSL